MNVRALFALLSLSCASAFAGDVQAVIKNGSLFVTGSGATDVFVIYSPTPATGTVSFTSAPGTTVNGSSNVVEVAGLVKDVRVEDDLGDDNITINGDFPRDVRVRTGAGADRLFLSVATIARDLKVDLGDDTDQLDVDMVSVGDSVRARLGDVWGAVRFHELHCSGLAITLGDQGPSPGSFLIDEISVEGRLTLRTKDDAGTLTVKSAEVDDDARFTTGRGDATVKCEVCDFHGDVRARLQDAGTFTLANCTIDGDLSVDQDDGMFATTGLKSCDVQGDAKLEARATETSTMLDELHCFGDLRIETAGGRDVVHVNRVAVEQDFRADLGSGDDTLTFDVILFQRARLFLGAGNDEASLATQCQLKSLAINAGSGADLLSINEGKTNENMRLSMGSGDNYVLFVLYEVVQNLKITCGDGDDTIDTSGVAVGGTKTIHPGGGANTVN